MKDIEYELMGRLHRKIAAVQGQLQALEKSGNNAFAKYRYSTADDVLNAVRLACAENGLSINLRVVHSELLDARSVDGNVYPNSGALVTVAIKVTDVETGAYDEGSAPGYAEDIKGTKAIFAAITGGSKYCVRSFFCLASDDDPEKTPTEREARAAASKATIPARPASPPKPPASLPRSPAQEILDSPRELPSKLKKIGLFQVGMTRGQLRKFVQDTTHRPEVMTASDLTDDECQFVIKQLQTMIPPEGATIDPETGEVFASTL